MNGRAVKLTLSKIWPTFGSLFCLNKAILQLFKRNNTNENRAKQDLTNHTILIMSNNNNTNFNNNNNNHHANGGDEQERAQALVSQLESNRRKRQRRTLLVQQTSNRTTSHLPLHHSSSSSSSSTSTSSSSSSSSIQNKRQKTTHNNSTENIENNNDDENNIGDVNDKYSSEEQRQQFTDAMNELDQMLTTTTNDKNNENNDKDNDNGDDNDNLLDSIQFGTVNLALLKLKQLCQGTIPVPIMLKHMLHAMLEPNMQTQVERELDELIDRGTIRAFHMHHLGSNVTAYCYTEDLIRHIRYTVSQVVNRGDVNRELYDTVGGDDDEKCIGVDRDSGALREYRQRQVQLRASALQRDHERLRELSERFICELLPQYTDTAINVDELRGILDCDALNDITLLMKIGLFTMKDSYTYYFNAPGAGQFITEVKGGREEIVSVLKRKKYREIMLHTLRERKLKKSSLALDWHIRELLGLGTAEITQTSNGPMLKLK